MDTQEPPIEELRSANRRLETALETARAANEELGAANADLTQRLENLARSHDDLHNLIASSDLATLFLDREMRIQRYTPRIAGLFNVIPADVGRPLLHITNRLEHAHLAEEAARVFETLQPLEQEVRSKDGRDYIVRVHPYRTTEGRIGGAVMTFFDITSRRLAEKALRESEERQAFLLRLADAVRPLSATAEIQGEAARLLRDYLAAGWCYYVEWDEAAARGVVLRDAAREGLPSLAGTHDVSDVPEFLDIIRKGTVLNVADYASFDGLSPELRARYTALGFRSMLVATLVKDGRLVASLIVGDTEVRDWSGHAERLLMEVAERTWAAVERGRAEEALRESEEKYRTLFEKMDEGFALCELIRDVDGRTVDYRYVELNHALVRHVGITPETLIGHRATEFFDLDPWLIETYTRVVETGESVLEEHYFPHVDLWLRINAFPRGGNRFAVLFGNVTKRKRAEEALRVANERLQEGDRRKDEFLATLAHELRNPLAPISNALQFLRHPGGKRRADRLLMMVERQVRHMVRLVDELMEASRISRGKVDLQRAPVALAVVLHAAVETSQPAFDPKRQQLTVDVPDETLKLDADKDRLTQVFTNLLNNAAKYTPPGGQVWLCAQRDGHEAVVRVRDTGMGIDEKQLPLIFEMFSQPHGRNGHTDSGLGIGLAMVRSLVELHGGVVQAHSEGPGKGCEFVVRLPLIDCPDTALRNNEGTVDLTAMPLTGRRVLIVDDNRDAADSLRELLAARGAETMAVYDGRSAIQALNNAIPHAIVLDIGMPDMDGYEVALKIRQDKRAAGITLIALSGWGQDVDRERSRACGFDHHLTKPAELGSLFRILGHYHD
jgi:signal transduction histidine kinase